MIAGRVAVLGINEPPPEKHNHLNISMNLLINWTFSLPSGFARMLLIRTIKQRLELTLRWSGSKCWAFLSAYSCKSPISINIIWSSEVNVIIQQLCVYVKGGTLQAKSGSSVLLLRTTGELRVSSYHVDRWSTHHWIWSKQFNWRTMFLFSSCDYRVWRKWRCFFGTHKVS